MCARALCASVADCASLSAPWTSGRMAEREERGTEADTEGDGEAAGGRAEREEDRESEREGNKGEPRDEASGV